MVEITGTGYSSQSQKPAALPQAESPSYSKALNDLFDSLDEAVNDLEDAVDDLSLEIPDSSTGKLKANKPSLVFEDLLKVGKTKEYIKKAKEIIDKIRRFNRQLALEDKNLIAAISLRLDMVQKALDITEKNIPIKDIFDALSKKLNDTMGEATRFFETLNSKATNNPISPQTLAAIRAELNKTGQIKEALKSAREQLKEIEFFCSDFTNEIQLYIRETYTRIRELEKNVITAEKELFRLKGVLFHSNEFLNQTNTPDGIMPLIVYKVVRSTGDSFEVGLAINSYATTQEVEELLSFLVDERYITLGECTEYPKYSTQPVCDTKHYFETKDLKEAMNSARKEGRPYIYLSQVVDHTILQRGWSSMYSNYPYLPMKIPTL
ncbi:hypothetical protein A3J90_01650 [candidate division WOR-1 bacterium RIFOXYC2_FULL_37_10]|uniref:Uncharacterized protein n=1 Tax=candidate division WOR-1 bacterium RIFOXYB2_FULL_37_13 TaxID=1802579 RepID=A0A1F4SPN6_UNCSA|nr:MAG: hypothetical protein A2246_02355 [candidate division WOR-1 bacterium RIFOXYA2_FULL_37_7]OGC22370.1 MAG: hypothetical protein A2310_01760 [candidate division WOR-1 bacterium RIFOXYB2_FULL_37_13]OGC35808.1 MAG: hypothetical protein A3J90_01650 [candidate division WOR-1 bacterium RIFOXYC2_FULL_37_10]